MPCNSSQPAVAGQRGFVGRAQLHLRQVCRPSSAVPVLPVLRRKHRPPPPPASSFLPVVPPRLPPSSRSCLSHLVVQRRNLVVEPAHRVQVQHRQAGLLRVVGICERLPHPHIRPSFRLRPHQFLCNRA